MNVEDIRSCCLAKAEATEDFPFDETTLVFRVRGKIFACIDLENTDWFCLKCDPDYAVELRDRYPSITGAWHWNKKYWNQVAMGDDVNDRLVRHLIDHAYDEVVKKLPRRVQRELAAAMAAGERTDAER